MRSGLTTRPIKTPAKSCSMPLCAHASLPSDSQINRQPKLVERPVSHSEQSGVPKINRQLSCPESAAVRRSNGSGTPSTRSRALIATRHSSLATAFLIATASRIEIVVSHSFQRRKHFLIATRKRVSIDASSGHLETSAFSPFTNHHSQITPFASCIPSPSHRKLLP
jgi:hypothetical protein